MFYLIGLEEEGRFLGSEGEIFQKQIYGTIKSLSNPTRSTKLRYRFFFISPCKDLENQHIKTSALPVMAKITSSLTILTAGELVGDWLRHSCNSKAG